MAELIAGQALKSLSLPQCDEHLDAVDEEPAWRGQQGEYDWSPSEVE